MNEKAATKVLVGCHLLNGMDEHNYLSPTFWWLWWWCLLGIVVILFLGRPSQNRFFLFVGMRRRYL